MSKTRNLKYSLKFTEKELSYLHNALFIYDQLSVIMDNDENGRPEKWDELEKMLKTVERVIDSIDEE